MSKTVPDFEAWSAQQLLNFLSTTDVSEAVGFAIEVYRERFPMTEEAVRVIERFLSSRLLDNRSAALEALVLYGNGIGYTVDAIVLNFLSRDDYGGTPAVYISLRAINTMAKRGDLDAVKARTLLNEDPFVREMIGLIE